ncbi:MAG: B-box zinc finger protein, partial [Ignavibacteriaceae bacterium]|nr:B-box zinc finger protein [Ignavibacteriaceae bacterium]
MVQHCVNHSEKEALSFCRSCGEYFCSDCLNEGLEYFYCKKDECIKALNKELSQRKNEKVKNVTLSKESKFIRRVAIIFILLSLVALIDSLIRIKNTMLFYLIPEGVGISSHFFGFLVKYGWISLIVSLAIIIFSLFASIKIYSRKCRKLFLYALIFNIFLICLYNLYIYT